MRFLGRVRSTSIYNEFVACLAEFNTQPDVPVHVPALAQKIEGLRWYGKPHADLVRGMNSFLPAHQHIRVSSPDSPGALAPAHEQLAPPRGAIKRKAAPKKKAAATRAKVAGWVSNTGVKTKVAPKKKAAGAKKLQPKKKAAGVKAKAVPPAPAKGPKELLAEDMLAAEAARECFRLLHRCRRRRRHSSATAAAAAAAAPAAETGGESSGALAFDHTQHGKVAAATAQAIAVLVRLSQQLEQHRHLTKLACSASSQSDGPIQIIGSFLFHNGHPLRQLDKSFSVSIFGRMTCRYGDNRLDLRAAIALVRKAVEAVHRTKPRVILRYPKGLTRTAADWLGDGGDSWWWDYGGGLWEQLDNKQPTQDQQDTFECDLKALQAVEHIAALDRIAANVDAMDEVEANRFDMLRTIVEGETETFGMETFSDGNIRNEPALSSVLRQFIHGGDDYGDGELRLVKYPLIYPAADADHYYHCEDLSPVVTIHDSATGKVVPQVRKCSKCGKWSSDAIMRHCASRYCDLDFCGTEGGDCEPTCGKCWGLETCFTCGKSGCPCRFERCSKPGCEHLMCNCTNFSERNRGRCGSPPGCAKFVPDDEEEEDSDEEFDDFDAPLFCFECAPAGARLRR